MNFQSLIIDDLIFRFQQNIDLIGLTSLQVKKVVHTHPDSYGCLITYKEGLNVMYYKLYNFH